ncbi:YceD family protein [Legionella brunensis]|uniref:Large ribosomal RNA subunit accumulation protein YceD n=1 Tax=Legionella brunensis TaxID=29422 RepID=A0A0W0S594_9GAMM|nr:YceD family protein [Legionella brunensis]KTC78228.1 metal-binding protein [Legionella brunensis]
MLINLKNSAAKTGVEQATLELHERLPAHINPPCVTHCQFSIESQNNYYLLNLTVNSMLTITCQRCLKEFNYQYVNNTTLAICHSDEIAEKLMEQYECVISEDGHVNLNELITDELHLYVPELHPEISDCDSEINRFFGADSTMKL